jgi:hypothetical protein
MSIDIQFTLWHSYPILYGFLVLPKSVIRWTGFIQENTGRHVNTMPPAAIFAGRIIYGLSGICNVILFLKTRPRLLLMMPPDQSSPTRSHRRVGSNGQIAPSFSLENGRHWVGEDLESTAEGYQTASGDGGSMVASAKVARISSAMELETRISNGKPYNYAKPYAKN